MRVEPHQLPIVIRVPVARPCSSGLDIAEDRTSVASNCVVSHELLPSSLPRGSQLVSGREWPELSARGCRWHRAVHSKSQARSESPPVRRFLLRQTAQSAKGPRSKLILSAEYPQPWESNNRADFRLCPGRTPPSEPCPAPVQRRLRSGPRLASD